MTQLHSDPFLAKNVCHHSRVNGYFPPALYVLSQKGEKYMMNQQQLAASTDTQTSQSTVSILPNKNTFTKRNDKTNNEIINQNSQSTSIYHPKHGKEKQVAWQHGETVRRMGAFCSFFSSISCLFSSRSSRADLKTWWPWWPWWPLPFNPGMWGFWCAPFCTKEINPGKEKPTWVEPIWLASKIQGENSSGWGPQTSARSPGLLLWASAVILTFHHTVHAVLSCMVHLVYPLVI